MFDISDQLFPNIITILVQLCATGVIFLIYKKYLHQPVLKIMDKKAEDFHSEYAEIESMKEAQKASRVQFEEEKKSQELLLDKQKKCLLKDLDTMRDTLVAEAKQDAKMIQDQAALSIEKERLAMMQDVEQEIIGLSSLMVEKVLDGYTFSETDMVHALEKEFKNNYDQS